MIFTPKRQAAFILVSANNGLFIVNRNDHNINEDNETYGVGSQLLNYSSYDQEEIYSVCDFLRAERKHRGNGVIAIDCGANIGAHCIEWAKAMTGWGSVIAFEPQEKIYYALAGNTIINNCLNITAHQNAVGGKCEEIKIPKIDYLKPGSYGSLEIKKREKTENIGQNIDYQNNVVSVNQVTIDSFNYPRVDFIKLDVEGMEYEVLLGCAETIDRCKPIFMIEMIKCDTNKVMDFLNSKDYSLFAPNSATMIAISSNDPVISYMNNIKRVQ